MAEPKAILIAGPTASGKSALAMALATRLGGTIINADSMQVYRELRVLTARPTVDEERSAPHALYGFVPAREAYSAGRYAGDVARAIADVRAAGRRPILVGGTGLYFKTLLEGLSPMPPIADDVRSYWRQRADALGAAALHAELARRDAEMAARLAPTDTQRIVRALEVMQSTGRSLAAWQRVPGTPIIAADEAVRLVVSVERASLHTRADARFEAMMAAGALGEAQALAALDLDPALPAMRAIGVAPLMAAARGAMPLKDAVAAAKAETRQYIKRQDTWLRRNMMSWQPVELEEMQISLASIMPFIDC